jgi:hypothetical protein
MPKPDAKQKIRDHIRTLQELERFMNDPFTAPVLESIFGPYQNGNYVLRTAAAPDALPSDPSTQRGHLTDAVKKACAEMPLGLPFTSKNVIDRLLAGGFVFQAKDRAVAVNSVLKRLVALKLVEQTQAAAGKRPASYKISRSG